MNPQTQKQPDFNFILSQPGPDDIPKKKRSPLVWVLGGVLAVAIILVGVLLFVVPSKNVQNSAFPVTDTSDAYIAHLKDNRYEAAYDLLANSVQAESTLDNFKEVAKPLYANIDLQNCQRTSKDIPSITNDMAEISYSCPVKETDVVMFIDMQLIKEDDTIRIKDVSMAPRL